MRKLLILAGIFTVLAYNNAQARYYEENGYYYEEKPRYERQVRYREEPKYARQEPVRYRRLSNEEVREYEERQLTNTASSTIRPYIGVDIATTKMKFGKNEWMKDDDEDDNEIDAFEKSNKAFSLIAGVKFNQHFGLEAFYQKSGKETKNIYEDEGEDWSEKQKTELSYAAYGIDAIGYMPVTQEVELLASLGFAQYDFKTKFIDNYSEIEDGEKYSENEVDNKDFDSLGIRIGIGAQYNINEHFALRAMARYIKMDDDEYIKSLTELSLGLRYMF